MKKILLLITGLITALSLYSSTEAGAAALSEEKSQQQAKHSFTLKEKNASGKKILLASASDQDKKHKAGGDHHEKSAEGHAHKEGHDHKKAHKKGHGGHSVPSPPFWSVIPFIVLLLLIATGPLFFAHFWHKYYPVIAVTLGLAMAGYYLFILGNQTQPIHSLAEYVQFIALLSSLFIASGGILIKVDKEGTPLVNVTLLVIGSVIANFIGTPGASMLLLRPYIRLNENRIQAYHIVFFIFMVSNVGGALTPIGDPPLFLGFLKGVPFFWTVTHNIVPWAFAIGVLAIIFYLRDRKNKENYSGEEEIPEVTGKISFQGKKNFIWLAVIIISVFIDPNIMPWVPGIPFHGQEISFIREAIMFSVCYLSYRYADSTALKENEFEFEPIREVAFLFIGIFGTMMPALQLIGEWAQSPEGSGFINADALYWMTGSLSGFLDNAPTYLNFLAASIAAKGGSLNSIEDVQQFAAGGYANSVIQLMAISVASVFFGAMTYIGNGPNFMVKSIAEQVGIRMPSFFGYMIRFSIPILLPILFVVWLIFF